MKPVFFSKSSSHFTFPSDKNLLVFSSLTQLEHVETDAGLSIKYVLKGSEHYILDGHLHEVTAGQYLIVNRGREYEVSLHNSEPIEGLCIYLETRVVADTLRTLTLPDRTLLDKPNTEDAPCAFYEHVFSDQENRLGSRLRALARAKASLKDKGYLVPPDLYHVLATDLIRSQIHLQREAARIPAAKPSTRAELYRRVRRARRFIEAEYTNSIRLDDIANTAALSESHLIRTFHHVFGRSPYQYVLELRMHRAAMLLRRDQDSITEIAHQVGFADLPSFTKAFKKHFGYPPSHLLPGTT